VGEFSEGVDTWRNKPMSRPPAGYRRIRGPGSRLLEWPSEDIDLFTGWNRRDEFSTAVEAVVQAYRDDGLAVDLERRYDTFALLAVSDGSHTSKVELGVDWRANEPILMAVRPVLHPDDAVANKMSAVYGRALARDFVDIDAAPRRKPSCPA
jgi:hypothetical protein